MNILLQTVFHTLELAVVLCVAWLILHYLPLGGEVEAGAVFLAVAAIAKYGRAVGVLPDNPNICIKPTGETKKTPEA